MGEIDWNTELKKIERQFEGLPPERSPAELRAQREAERQEQLREQERGLAVAATARLIIVLSLAAAIVAWPYARACGAGLFAYLGAIVAIVIGGLWAAVWTWRARTALTHALAMLVVLWGLVLGSAQVLPRVGYAKVLTGAEPTWRCWGPTPGR